MKNMRLPVLFASLGVVLLLVGPIATRRRGVVIGTTLLAFVAFGAAWWFGTRDAAAVVVVTKTDEKDPTPSKDPRLLLRRDPLTEWRQDAETDMKLRLGRDRDLRRPPSAAARAAFERSLKPTRPDLYARRTHVCAASTKQ